MFATTDSARQTINPVTALLLLPSKSQIHSLVYLELIFVPVTVVIVFATVSMMPFVITISQKQLMSRFH